jgi:hypothetical protein
MRTLTKILYSTATFDALFAAVGLVALSGLALSAGHGIPAIEPAASPLAKGAAVVGALVGGAALASQTSRLDQKLADDFLYHTLTKSAFIAIMAFVFAAVLWVVLFQHSLGGLSSSSMVALIVGAWSLSYFYTRVRGTRP